MGDTLGLAVTSGELLTAIWDSEIYESDCTNKVSLCVGGKSSRNKLIIVK